MTAQILQFTLPVARVVQGDLYRMQDKDRNGQLRVTKSGPNMGKPDPVYFFAIAIPKTPPAYQLPEAGAPAWSQTEWGYQIWAAGKAAWPQGHYQRADFAWKIDDGDSTTPKGDNNKRNVDREGFPGNWIISFNTRQALRIFNRDGSQQITDEGAVKRGYYVELFVSVKSNESTQTAGMYINPGMMALAAYGEEISSAPDPSQAGFGRSTLPPGASAAPVGGAFKPAPTPAPGAAYMPPGAAAAAPPPVAAPTAVRAAPGFITPPAVGAPAPAPVPAPVPAPPPGVPAPPPSEPRLTALANGATYGQMIAAGWSDALLRAHGYLA